MRVLIAPGRFAGTVTAPVAARTLAAGWAETAPEDTVTTLPLSDGAAGLLDVVHQARGGTLVPVTTTMPLGRPVPGAVLHVPGAGGGTAYVEADQVLGTHLLAPGERAEAAARGSSAGLGRLLLAALATGAGRVVVGLGLASSSHDGGAGLLAALAGPDDPADDPAGGPGAPVGETADPATPDAGARDDAGPLTAGGLALGGLAPDAVAGTLERARRQLRGTDLVLAVTDDAPLLGLHGAGAVLGQDPAVGAVAAQDLERALGHACDVLERHAPAAGPANLPLVGGSPGATTGARPGAPRLARTPGTGAGGGAGFALQLLGARALDGADVVADAVGLAGAVAATDLVVTGSAVMDAPGLTRSVVATVARAALPFALPVVVVADEVHTSRREVSQLGISATYQVADAGPRARPAAAGAGAGLSALRARGARLARTWSV